MASRLLIPLFLFLSVSFVKADDGYRLWLRYDKIEDLEVLNHYRGQIQFVYAESTGEIMQTAVGELRNGVEGLLGEPVMAGLPASRQAGIVLGILGQSAMTDGAIPSELADQLKPEGFVLYRQPGNETLFIAGKDEKGVLYGCFHLLRMMQMHQPIEALAIVDNPAIQRRVLNHWDNLDRTVERGYAGFSIWNWHELPDFIDPRYRDYARANASIGINGTVVTNVNANALVFRHDYLEKVAALANVFRPYGLQIYLTARFSSPIELGGLETADPLDPAVQAWWTEKVNEIYALIPDFGGFLVKANSEGQPGPQNYGRTHADGANMLADALTPHGGVVMWRAFVYSDEEPDDRAKQAYNEFVPLDGTFRDNVLIQVKNGPIDFQPREPIHPLFGAMPETPLMMEFQITKEYLGQGTHLVGLANMYEEVLQTDTYAKGEGSTVASVIDGSLHGYQLTGIAGVSNIGTARNWTGNLFGQADWYGFGRLAWNPRMEAFDIFREWTEMTFTHDPTALETITGMLDNSYEACVKYMTPLGLHHIMGVGHHYGPGPWVSGGPRADWTSVYYHKADSEGVGFDRTSTGSDALSQYAPQFAAQYEDLDECPPELLLWFHHVPWDYKLSSGHSLWDELCYQYQEGVDMAVQLQRDWESVKLYLDEERYEHVAMHLKIQVKEANWWRDACLSYFRTFSGMDIPESVDQPARDLEYYQSLFFPYSPGIRPRW